MVSVDCWVFSRKQGCAKIMLPGKQVRIAFARFTCPGSQGTKARAAGWASEGDETQERPAKARCFRTKGGVPSRAERLCEGDQRALSALSLAFLTSAAK